MNVFVYLVSKCLFRKSHLTHTFIQLLRDELHTLMTVDMLIERINVYCSELKKYFSFIIRLLYSLIEGREGKSGTSIWTVKGHRLSLYAVRSVEYSDKMQKKTWTNTNRKNLVQAVEYGQVLIVIGITFNWEYCFLLKKEKSDIIILFIQQGNAVIFIEHILSIYLFLIKIKKHIQNSLPIQRYDSFDFFSKIPNISTRVKRMWESEMNNQTIFPTSLTT